MRLIENPFEASVASSLDSFPKDALFLAAVSGGADSTAMLAALSALQKKVCCLHVNHGIRSAEETQGDADAVKALCQGLGVPCTVVSIPQGKAAAAAKERGIGMEASARLFRRKAWQEEADRIGAMRVLVAHTRDDLVETFLMRLLCGSGPAGLAGMRRESGIVLRPILALTRHDVLTYLKERGLSYRNDSSNANDIYLRNRIRHNLIPVLDMFPDWRKTLFAAYETQGMVADFLEMEARKIQWTSDKNNSILYADREIFFAAPLIVREEALFSAVDRISVDETDFMPDAAKKAAGPPKRSVIRAFSQGSITAADAGPVRIETDGKRITVAAAARISESGFALLIKTPGVYRIGESFFEVPSEDEVGDKKFPFILRRNHGE
jgi:tRNA(Ile)-lysidine synthase